MVKWVVGVQLVLTPKLGPLIIGRGNFHSHVVTLLHGGKDFVDLRPATTSGVGRCNSRFLVMLHTEFWVSLKAPMGLPLSSLRMTPVIHSPQCMILDSSDLSGFLLNLAVYKAVGHNMPSIFWLPSSHLSFTLTSARSVSGRSSAACQERTVSSVARMCVSWGVARRP